MPGAPDLILIRPVLNSTRAELVAYCRAEGIAWREDATNIDTRHQRNWIRHEVMPLLREANPSVTDALARLASISAEQDDYLQQTVEQQFREHAIISKAWVWLPRGVYSGWHPAMQKRALIYARGIVNAESEPNFERIQAAAALAQTPEGGVAELGGGIQLEIDSGWLSISHSSASWSPPFTGYWMAYSGGNLTLKQLPASGEIHHLQLIKIKVPHDSVINVRTRRGGDRVYPSSLTGKSQKLKDWLINRKVARQLRDHLPIIEAGNQIVAIWNTRDWETFAPPFPNDTIEISLMANNQLL